MWIAATTSWASSERPMMPSSQNGHCRAADRTLLTGTRYTAVRNLFFSHGISRRAQLGLYQRSNDRLVPSIYGPSADES